MKEAKKLLRNLCTEYIHDILSFNNIRYDFSVPLAVGFGSILPWKFVCASSKIIDKTFTRERLDFGDYISVLRPYFLLVDSQSLIL